jgi:hypothetical protein
MENVDFLQKTVQLAQESQRAFERLRSVGAEIAKFYAPLTVTFSPFFNVLFNFIYQQALLSQTIRRMALAGFNVIFPYRLWLNEVAQVEEESFLFERKQQDNLTLMQIITPLLEPKLSQTSSQVALSSTFPQKPGMKRATRQEDQNSMPATGKLRVPFVSSYLMAKELTSNLFAALAEQPFLIPEQVMLVTAENVASKGRPPKREVPAESPLSEKVPPLMKVETRKVVEKEKPLEKTREEPHVNHFVEWQSELSFKILPSVKTLSSLLQYEKTAVPLALSTVMAETALDGFTGLRTLESSQFTRPPEKTTIEEKVAEPIAVKVSEAAPPEVPVGPKLAFQSLSAFAYAGALPTLILEKETPFLQVAAAISLASSLPTSTLSPHTEPSHGYPEIAVKPTAPIASSQINIISKEVSPSLISWIYEGSEALRSTHVALSAVPIGASIAEKVVTETLIQPISSLETARPHGHQEPATEEEKFSRLPTMLALAGAGSLIAYRLQRELTALTRKTQTAKNVFAQIPTATKGRLVHAEASGTTSVSELTSEIAAKFLSVASAVPAGKTTVEATRRPSQTALIAGSVAAITEASAVLLGAPYVKATAETSKTVAKATALASRAATAALVASSFVAMSELYAGASAEAAAGTSAIAATRAFSEAALAQSHPAAYIPNVPPVSQLPSKPLSAAPVIKNNLNFEPDETLEEEEDLRDLERKIRKILSEQISRYYGSSMIGRSET